MDGKDLKKMMRKHGVSVRQLARYLGSTETGIRRMQAEDADYFYFEDLAGWEKRIKLAGGYRTGAYISS